LGLPSLSFAPLRPEHGKALHALVAACKPLDENSLYCNLLQTSHFGATSMGAWQQPSNADHAPQLVGSVTGYFLPDAPQTLYIWQVAVLNDARGRGIGQSLLRHLLANQAPSAVAKMQTSITSSNRASWQLFERFAQTLNAPTHVSVLFETEKHFGGAAPTEHVLTIGPISADALNNSTHARAVDGQEHASTRSMPELTLR
jgi:L-2,4-diaminobutyric acid acetyltransferase